MRHEKQKRLVDFFTELEDPRREKCKKHLLSDLTDFTVENRVLAVFSGRKNI